jgi:hypothetical protein
MHRSMCLLDVVDVSADSQSPGVSYSTVSQQDDNGDPDFPHPLFIPLSRDGIYNFLYLLRNVSGTTKVLLLVQIENKVKLQIEIHVVDRFG